MTLSKITTIRATSKNLPAGVSASNMIVRAVSRMELIYASTSFKLAYLATAADFAGPCEPTAVPALRGSAMPSIPFSVRKTELASPI